VCGRTAAGALSEAACANRAGELNGVLNACWRIIWPRLDSRHGVILESGHEQLHDGGDYGRVIGALERVPYSLLAIPLRLAVATVFWNSA
jgi:hypothetical protein